MYMCWMLLSTSVFFFFNDTATTEIYTLSLHDALPIYLGRDRLRPKASWAFRVAHDPHPRLEPFHGERAVLGQPVLEMEADRKSTRLNSSHVRISYAVFCLKKKKRQMVPRFCDNSDFVS